MKVQLPDGVSAPKSLELLKPNDYKTVKGDKV